MDEEEAFQQVNTILVETYWNIGRRIVEYGSRLLKELAWDLSRQYGKGFSRSTLQYMRLLYIKYPKLQTLSGKLSWSHYTELLSISDDLSRCLYEKQCIKELKRQRQSGLFERLALSKDKEGVLQPAGDWGIYNNTCTSLKY